MRSLALRSLFALSFFSLAAGCAATTTRGNGSGGGGGGGSDAGTGSDRDADIRSNLDLGPSGEDTQDMHFDPDAYWAQDPPLMYCYPDGGVPPKPPGGTPECPDDKNREGCACDTEGMMAPCWPGLRVNRNLGICHDGTTTCQKFGETQLAWGPCMDYQLPDPNATDGKDACKCFSAGQWKLDNLSPCFFSDNMNTPGNLGATSTTLAGNMVQCPSEMGTPLVPPNMPWSNDTVTADCAGHFRICYALKAGDAKNPSPMDCTVSKVCTEADYTTVNMAQPFPPLPAWATTDMASIACAQKFATSGGYGEMSVVGKTITCDMFSRVFNRVNYCPLSCNQNPMGPNCQGCGTGGGGNF